MKEFWIVQVKQAMWNGIQLLERGFATGSVNAANILYHFWNTPLSVIHVPGVVKIGEQPRNIKWACYPYYEENQMPVRARDEVLHSLY